MMKPAVTAAEVRDRKAKNKTHYPRGDGFTYCGLPVESVGLVNRDAACWHCIVSFKPKQTLEIRLGAAADLAAQLKPYGFTEEEIRVLVDDNHALNRSYIRGYLTESEVKKARKRLFGKIEHYVKEKTNEKQG